MSGSTTTQLPTVADVERISTLSDPALRNLQITQCYHELARAMSSRLGGGANWCAFATWASKQAGQTIRKEDLRRHLVFMINESLAAQDLGELIVARALAADSPLSGDAVRATLWRSLDPGAALDHASRAVARGNLKVFAEIAPAFARFNDQRLHDPAHDAEAIERFVDELQPGDPPGGQGYLRRAFMHYYDALFTTDPRARSELLFLGNLEVGFHEQTRLQPEISAALDLPELEPRRVTDQLIDALFPQAGWIALIRRLLRRLLRAPTPLERALSALVTEVRRQARRLLTEHFLTLDLANGVRLRLGHDLRGEFPDTLQHIINTELTELLQRIDPTPDSRIASGALDWTDLPERMHFICDFFRCQHQRPDLFAPPFSPEQAALLKAGSLPAGEL